MKPDTARRRLDDRAPRTLSIAAGALASLFALFACSKASPSPVREHRTRVSASSTPHGAESAKSARFETLAACRPRATFPCDIRTDVCQHQLFELMQCMHGSRGAVRPPLRFVSPELSRQRLAQDRAKKSMEQGPLARAVTRLGLGSGVSSPASNGVGPNAYYAPEERAVFFVESDAIPFASELASFIVGHEYVHALQDRDGALARVLESRATRTFEQELSVWSTLEGEATLFEEVLRAFVHQRDPRTWILPRLAGRTAGSDEEIVRQRRPLEASFATFPYTYGAHWAAAEWLTRGAPIATAPHDGRLSTHAFLAARHGWPKAGERECPDESPPSLNHGQVRRARESLGAWLLQTYVRRRTQDAERARNAALSFRGDWLALYASEADAEPSFTWRTCWDSADTAREMQELVEAQLRETSAGRATVTIAGADVIAAVSL